MDHTKKISDIENLQNIKPCSMNNLLHLKILWIFGWIKTSLLCWEAGNEKASNIQYYTFSVECMLCDMHAGCRRIFLKEEEEPIIGD